MQSESEVCYNNFGFETIFGTSTFEITKFLKVYYNNFQNHSKTQNQISWFLQCFLTGDPKFATTTSVLDPFLLHQLPENQIPQVYYINQPTKLQNSKIRIILVSETAVRSGRSFPACSHRCYYINFENPKIPNQTLGLYPNSELRTSGVARVNPNSDATPVTPTLVLHPEIATPTLVFGTNFENSRCVPDLESVRRVGSRVEK